MKYFYYQHLDEDNEQYVLDYGSLEILHLSENIEELRLVTRTDRIDLILIYSLLGRFLFIPQQNFGITLTDLADTEANEQLLSRLPNPRPATAISAALHDYVS